MLVFRSFAIGLTAACFALLVMRPAVVVVPKPVYIDSQLEIELPPSIALTAPAPALAQTNLPPTIIDVAPRVSLRQLQSLIRLAPGEHITSVDDLAVNGELDAGLMLANLEVRDKRFIDLGVSGPGGERRVLVLLH